MGCEHLIEILQGDAKCYSQATSAAENGKKFAFDNPARKTVCRVRVDNCLITDKGIKKCDFLFKINDDKKYYLVELKGQAIDTAVAQIESTYDFVNRKIKAAPQDYTGIIVSSAVPKAANQKFKNLQDRLYRNKKLLVKRRQFQFEERI